MTQNQNEMFGQEIIEPQANTMKEITKAIQRLGVRIGDVEKGFSLTPYNSQISFKQSFSIEYISQAYL